MQRVARTGLLMLFALGAYAGPSRADDTIKHPGDHPNYAVEVEPHLLLGWDGIYAASGFGAGARFSIPIVQNGFVKSINNSVAIGFGADLTHYSRCYGRGAVCDANYLTFPVVMQWNFFVAQRWSVFGEPGLYVYNGFFDDCAGCDLPRRSGIRPAFFAGGRFHFSEKVSLTMRLGWPSASVGVSFFL